MYSPEEVRTRCPCGRLSTVSQRPPHNFGLVSTTTYIARAVAASRLRVSLPRQSKANRRAWLASGFGAVRGQRSRGILTSDDGGPRLVRRTVTQGQASFNIATMPRGGPDASWLDRQLQTQRAEYLDRNDVDNRKRAVVRSMDRLGRLFRHHETFARMAHQEIADLPGAKVLELGAAHGGLSRALLRMHATARVSVTDIESTSVAEIATSDLGSHPRATIREIDATAIDTPDQSYDLAVLAMSFHHMPPAQAACVFAEGTRVADKLLIIDVQRLPSLLLIVQLILSLPLVTLVPVVHDAMISNLRAYSRSALRTMAYYADRTIVLDLRGRFSLPVLPQPQIVVASRRRTADAVKVD